MYPKVKVRQEKEEDAAVGLKMLESLCMHVSSSPEKEDQDVLPIFIAGSPRSPVSSVVTPPRSPVSSVVTPTRSPISSAVTPTISMCKETEKSIKKIDQKDKQNKKATPILRPRAVLSSPDNDPVVGNNNRIRAERPTALRNHDMLPNRHANAQCKVSPTHIMRKSRINTIASNDVPDNKSDQKSDVKGKKGSMMAVPRQKRYLRIWKS